MPATVSGEGQDLLTIGLVLT